MQPFGSRHAWGTPGYIAPELVAQRGLVSSKCDVYSLGITFLGMISEEACNNAMDLAGDLPFVEWHLAMLGSGSGGNVLRRQLDNPIGYTTAQLICHMTKVGENTTSFYIC